MSQLNYLWRWLATASAFFIFGIGGVLIPMLAAPVIRLSTDNPLVRQHKAQHLVHRLFSGFIGYLRFMGVLDWEIEGRERLLNQKNAVIVANHPSLLDVVFLVALVPNAVCVIKRTLLANPAMRGLVTLAGYITNDSGNQMLDQARQALETGGVIVIFPEGTRTTLGQELHFLRGAANIVVRLGARVIPVLIHCQPHTLSKQHKWYHVPPRKIRLGIEVLGEYELVSYKNMNPSSAARRLTQDLQDYFTEELSTHEQ